MARPCENENIFQYIDKTKAYVLGFLWADGYIRRSNICTEISSKDFENLNRIIPITGNWKIYHREKFLKKTCKYYKQSSFIYGSRLTYDFLKSMDYDIKSQSSPIKILEYLPEELHNHFYRGYIDGDGSFSFYVGSNGTSMQCKFNITSTIEQNWDFMEKLFKKLEIDSYLINKYDRKSGKSSIISINNKWGIIKLGEYLYTDFDNDKLDRKYDKYLEIKNSNVVKAPEKWTNNDILFLKQNYRKNGLKYCCEKLNRTSGSIYKQVFLLFDDKKNSVKWTDELDKILIDYYSTNGINYCVNLLNIDKIKVKRRVVRLKLKLQKKTFNK